MKTMKTMNKVVVPTSLFAAATLLAPSLALAASDAIITEYVEGSGNNKAVELYNPSEASIDLAGYVLEIYFNGSTTVGTSIALSGTIASHDTFVVADNDANAGILAVTDQTSAANFFNGDDAIVLRHDGAVVDSLGQVGTDPGSQWGSGLLSTQDNTLVRDPALVADTDPTDAVTLDGWIGLATDDISNLGSYGEGPGDGGDDDDGGDGAVLSCTSDVTAIHAIQGDGLVSALVGQSVDVQGVVTSNQEAGLRGFYLQTPDAAVDGDVQTSEGIFVYTGNAPRGVVQGNLVRVRATVAEFNGLTELTNVLDVATCEENVALPQATTLALPWTSLADAEAYEGMLVEFEQNLTVNEVYQLGRYGEVLLGSERHFIGTQVASPGSAALAVSAANLLDSILLDDGLTVQNPDPVIFPAPALSASNTLRVGDSFAGLQGVMHEAFGLYRIMPTQTTTVVATNPRPIAPASVAADVKVASFNVLNYFNGDGLGGGFPTARGANSADEFARQREKTLAAIAALDADIIGLLEIENDGYGPQSAIADLVDGLNALTSAGTYAFVDPGLSQIGTDEIAVGIIYRSAAVQPTFAAEILSSVNSPLDAASLPLFNDHKNRPMLTQAFELVGKEQTLVVAVNHLKSKGSDCNDVGDPDLFDGQGNCNLTRTRAATAISTWLSATYADMPQMILGDLNAYAKEDPITELIAAGYEDLSASFGAAGAYSYVFSGESGELDHALANSEVLSAVVDVQTWHINADEPRALDYNLEFKSPGQQVSYYSGDAYRSSDHDPVIVSLAFETPNLAPIADIALFRFGPFDLFFSFSYDPDGYLVAHDWRFNGAVTRSGPIVARLRGSTAKAELTVTDNLGKTGYDVISRK